MPELPFTPLQLAYVLYNEIHKRLPAANDGRWELSFFSTWEKQPEEVREALLRAVDESLKQLADPNYSHFDFRLPKEEGDE